MIILDVEASGLHEDSYPIQVAWLNTDTGEEDSFYIKPEEEWTYWDINAEDIHNIPRKLLDDVGIPADLAVKRLLSSLGKKVDIYTDAPDFDGFWLSKLFGAVLVDPEVNVKVRSVYEVCQYQEDFYALQEIMHSQERPHDALEDCRMIWQAIKEVVG
jgi:hypothetical protein